MLWLWTRNIAYPPGGKSVPRNSSSWEEPSCLCSDAYSSDVRTRNTTPTPFPWHLILLHGVIFLFIYSVYIRGREAASKEGIQLSKHGLLRQNFVSYDPRLLRGTRNIENPCTVSSKYCQTEPFFPHQPKARGFFG